jgi:hypothetical protein
LFKDLIGHLNWKKFSERLSEQLRTNANLTHEQRRLMEVNQIVALLQALQFDQAREQWTLLSKTNTHPSMRGIGAYFYLKDKDYQKALSLI